jgi:hypothetical protein
MKYILFLNAAICFIIGFVLLFNPEFLLYSSEPNIHGLVTAKLYGIVMFCLGILAYVLSTNFIYSKMYKQIILCYTACHFSIGLLMYSIYNQNVSSNLFFSALHLGIALVSIIMYLSNIQKFENR